MINKSAVIEMNLDDVNVKYWFEVSNFKDK